MRPRKRGRTLTCRGALGVKGMVAAMTVEGGTEGAVFRPYIEQVLAPRLRPGQGVLMDNLTAHKVAGLREAIEAAHAPPRYLPRYSPDFSPLELWWSKGKTGLRARAARTPAALALAWTNTLASLTPSDARHWFARGGYRTAPD